MGYYRDVPKLEIKLVQHLPAAADAAPLVIKLDEVIVKDPPKKADKEDEPETCPIRKRTSTGRKSKGEGMYFKWPSDDSLAATSTFHRSQGHWAFETVNGSCWKTAAEYLAKTAADFVAVQETTTLEDSIVDTEHAARNKGWKVAMPPMHPHRGGGEVGGYCRMQPDAHRGEEVLQRRVQQQDGTS